MYWVETRACDNHPRIRWQRLFLVGVPEACPLPTQFLAVRFLRDVTGYFLAQAAAVTDPEWGMLRALRPRHYELMPIS